MGKVRPVCGLSTHCRLTPPTPCYLAPCYSSACRSVICQSDKRHLPFVFELLRHVPAVIRVAILPLHFSNCMPTIFPICYALLVTLHGHAFVFTDDVSRLDEHNDDPPPCRASNDLFSSTNVPQVASTSHAGNEQTYSPDYAKTPRVQFTQLGTQKLNIGPLLLSDILNDSVADYKSERHARRFHQRPKPLLSGTVPHSRAAVRLPRSPRTY
jgi:hypothetical protein